MEQDQPQKDQRARLFRVYFEKNQPQIVIGNQKYNILDLSRTGVRFQRSDEPNSYLDGILGNRQKILEEDPLLNRLIVAIADKPKSIAMIGDYVEHDDKYTLLRISADEKGRRKIDTVYKIVKYFRNHNHMQGKLINYEEVLEQLKVESKIKINGELELEGIIARDKENNHIISLKFLDPHKVTQKFIDDADRMAKGIIPSENY